MTKRMRLLISVRDHAASWLLQPNIGATKTDKLIKVVNGLSVRIVKSVIKEGDKVQKEINQLNLFENGKRKSNASKNRRKRNDD